jgi:PST family polysaccharide transporter
MAIELKFSKALSTEHLHKDLRGRSVRGVSLTLASQGLQFVMLSVSTLVLARLLTPADFGLVAMVTAITDVASAFSDLGLSEATIQRKEITHNQVSTLFWVNVAVGLGLATITAGLAPILAWFYREPRLKDITLWLSLSFLFSGLTVQHGALLKRQMRFVSLAIRDIACCILAVPLAIIVALKGGGYWAIVALPLTLNFGQMAFSWVMARWVPSSPRRDAHIGSMIIFGGNISASYLLTNVIGNIDNVLIGRYWGSGPLGLYSRASNLLMRPVRQLQSPVGHVAIPAFSRLQDDPERFARYYLRTVNLMTWIGAPIFGFLFVAAKPVFTLALGAKWVDAAPVFQILAISALGQVLHGTTLWLFVSRGQSGRLLRVTSILAPIFVGSYLIGLPFGIRGVAASSSLVVLVVLPWLLRYAFRGTHLTLHKLGRAMLRPTCLSLAGVVLAELALHRFLPRLIFYQFLVVALGFAAAFLLSALVPSVRREMASLRGILSELRTRTQTA